MPIRQRILYKLSTIVYKCIHGAAPSYLTNLCVSVATNTSRRCLRSATHGDLQVPRTRTVTYEPQSFAVSGPTIWNTLPSTLRVSTTTLGQLLSVSLLSVLLLSVSLLSVSLLTGGWCVQCTERRSADWVCSRWGKSHVLCLHYITLHKLLSVR